MGNKRTLKKKIDIRPDCITCGQRWMPPEGIDARRYPCDDCCQKVQAARIMTLATDGPTRNG